jgi:hypothetical protein
MGAEITNSFAWEMLKFIQSGILVTLYIFPFSLLFIAFVEKDFFFSVVARAFFFFC